jgi:ABC-type antimicrobial peptide transport system, permease component
MIQVSESTRIIKLFPELIALRMLMFLIELPLATLFILPKAVTFSKSYQPHRMMNSLIEHMDIPLATLFIPPPMEVTRLRDESTTLLISGWTSSEVIVVAVAVDSEVLSVGDAGHCTNNVRSSCDRNSICSSCQ